jgi:MFS-type transporter involved in bile tolerance (Atg22 family)
MNTNEARTRAPSRSSILGLDALTFLMADVRDGVGPYISVFLKGGLQWQSGEIGIAMATSSITAAICQIPAGLLVDSVRAKRLLVAISGLLVGMGCLLGSVATLELKGRWAR